MKIVLTGGGSGGHITPLLAVAHELKELQPTVEIIYIGQRGDKLSDVPAQNSNIDKVYSVRAGKLRRYSELGPKQLLNVSTALKNLRDSGRVIRGLAESRRLLKKIKPDAVFIKGGFVGVPVGLAAAQLDIPFVTHDSDAIPGLANRIIARWAKFHAVALPKEVYKYPPSKTFTVGVPISRKFVPVNSSLQRKYKTEIGLKETDQVIFITGGGNGAKQLNSIVVNCSKELLSSSPKLVIVHLSGRTLEADTLAAYRELLTDEEFTRVIVKGFVGDLYLYSGAADIIIGRGSATNLAEFATQSKPCILVPAKQLIWTVKNTEALAKNKAVVALDEDEALDNPKKMASLCEKLLSNAELRSELSKKLSKELAHANAASELAELILKTAD